MSIYGVFFKKNLNASRPSKHPPHRKKNVKTFRWDHRLKIQDLLMAFQRVPRCIDSMVLKKALSWSSVVVEPTPLLSDRPFSPLSSTNYSVIVPVQSRWLVASPQLLRRLPNLC